MISSHQLLFLNHFVAFILMIALFPYCCVQDGPVLESLRICDISKDDLDLDFLECPADITTVANNSPFITATVEVYEPEPTDQLVFRLFDEKNGGILLRQFTSKISEMYPEVSNGHCRLSAAVSIPRPNDGTWADLDYNIEVTLENEGKVPVTISKRFTII